MKIKYSKKSAQTFLEYSLLIAVGVSALIIMQYYFGRSVQGMLKQNVDSLGGEKIGEKQYTPGRWYGATSTTRISTSGFDYEGRKGFSVSTGSMQRSQVSKITGATNTSELAARTPPYSQTLINGEDVALVNNVEGSSVDPGIANVENSVNNNTPNWSNNTGVVNPTEDDPSSGIDREVVNTVDNHVNEGDVNASLDETRGQDADLNRALNTTAEAERNVLEFEENNNNNNE